MLRVLVVEVLASPGFLVNHWAERYVATGLLPLVLPTQPKNGSKQPGLGATVLALLALPLGVYHQGHLSPV